MIRSTALPRPLRIGSAVVGVAGMVALAGCAAPAAPAETPEPETVETPAAGETADTGTSGEGSGTYSDGTYTAEGSYQTPETTETIQVSITLASDVITAVEVTGDPQAAQSEQFQGRFIGGIEAEVVGQSIDDISVDRVAGSSLTSGGFNEAVETIKSDAAE